MPVRETIAGLLESPQMVHAALAHLPIGLAVVGVPLLVWNALRGSANPILNRPALAVYGVLALVAFVAVESGERASDELPNTLPAEVWEQVSEHEELAESIALIAVAVVIALAVAALVKREGLAAFLRWVGVAVGGVVLVVAARTGHEGGKLVYVYGVGTPALMVETHGAAGLVEGNSPSRAPAASGAQAEGTGPVSFARDVQPILTNYCVSCHNPSDAEGDLVLTTLSGLEAGGTKSGGNLLEGGEASALMGYLTGRLQPQMPKGEPALGESELAVVRAWLQSWETGGDGAADVEQVSLFSPNERSDGSDSVLNSFAAVGFPDGTLNDNSVRRRELRYEHLAIFGVPGSVDAKAARTAPLVLESEEAAERYRRAIRFRYVAPPGASPGGFENPIDQFIYAQLEAELPELASKAALLRRVYVDLTGVYPDANESAAILEDDSEDWYPRLVDGLLAERDGYAEHWVPFWMDALAGNPPAPDALGWRGDFRDWIVESFRENRPLDEFVLDLFVSSRPRFQRQFALTSDRAATLQTTSDVSRVFLGESMQCASCHNHFEHPEMTLSRTLGFAAYFAEGNLELVRCEKPSGQDIAPRLPHSLPDMDTKVPATLDARIAHAGRWLVDPTNERFAQVMVNRIWKRYLGVGLVEPADDWYAGSASHPELLAWLADDFRRNGYDVERLVRQILTSLTYRHASNTSSATRFDETDPEARRTFWAPGLRRVSGEQYWDSVRKILGQSWRGDARTFRQTPVPEVSRAFGTPTQRTHSQLERNEEASLAQALHFLNGSELHGAIESSPFLKQVVDDIEGEGAVEPALNTLYRQILSREATLDERELAFDYLRALETAETPLAVKTFVNDTAWALLASPEFLYVP